MIFLIFISCLLIFLSPVFLILTLRKLALKIKKKETISFTVIAISCLSVIGMLLSFVNMHIIYSGRYDYFMFIGRTGSLLVNSIIRNSNLVMPLNIILSFSLILYFLWVFLWLSYTDGAKRIYAYALISIPIIVMVFEATVSYGAADFFLVAFPPWGKDVSCEGEYKWIILLKFYFIWSIMFLAFFEEITYQVRRILKNRRNKKIN